MPRNNRTGKAVRRSLRPDSTRGIWRLSPCLAEFVRPAWPTPGPAPSAREPGAASTLPLDQVHPKSGGKIRPRQLRGNATSERRFVFSVELQSGRLDHAIQICRSRPRRRLRSGHDGYRIRAGKHRCAAGGGIGHRKGEGPSQGKDNLAAEYHHRHEPGDPGRTSQFLQGVR